MKALFIHKIRSTALILLLALTGSIYAGEYIERDFDADNFDFPLVIDNMYWPLIPGTIQRFIGDEGDECILSITEVTHDVKTFTGIYSPVKARVVSDKEYLDEECDGDETGNLLLEETLDWYAQDDFDNIWYFGEYTLSYEYDDDGNQVGPPDEGGSFEAGIDGAEPGYIMFAEPEKGMTYHQEYYEGEAEDMGKVKTVDAEVSLELQDAEFDGCVVIKEWNPLESATIEHKYFCPYDGLVLVRELSGGPTVRVEPVPDDLPED